MTRRRRASRRRCPPRRGMNENVYRRGAEARRHARTSCTPPRLCVSAVESVLLMSENPNKPGKGFLGWLGRQVGYVKQAVNTDVTAPPTTPAQPATLYREARVEEKDHPQDPNVK